MTLLSKEFKCIFCFWTQNELKVNVPVQHAGRLRAALRHQLVPQQGGGEPGVAVARPLGVGGGGRAARPSSLQLRPRSPTVPLPHALPGKREPVTKPEPQSADPGPDPAHGARVGTAAPQHSISADVARVSLYCVRIVMELTSVLWGTAETAAASLCSQTWSHTLSIVRQLYHLLEHKLDI